MQAGSASRTDAEKLVVHSHHISPPRPPSAPLAHSSLMDSLCPTFLTQTQSGPPSLVSIPYL